MLTKSEIRSRGGWDSEKIRHLLPKPVYVKSIPLWYLRDIEQAESSLAFYFEEVER